VETGAAGAAGPVLALALLFFVFEPQAIEQSEIEIKSKSKKGWRGSPGLGLMRALRALRALV
jgi:hypothetical protein